MVGRGVRMWGYEGVCFFDGDDEPVDVLWGGVCGCGEAGGCGRAPGCLLGAEAEWEDA